MKKTICDICGCDIEEKSFRNKIIQIPIAGKDAEGMYFNMHKFEDLCDKCIYEIGSVTAEKYYSMLKEHKNVNESAAAGSEEKAE